MSAQSTHSPVTPKSLLVFTQQGVACNFDSLIGCQVKFYFCSGWGSKPQEYRGQVVKVYPALKCAQVQGTCMVTGPGISCKAVDTLDFKEIYLDV